MSDWGRRAVDLVFWAVTLPWQLIVYLFAVAVLVPFLTLCVPLAPKGFRWRELGAVFSATGSLAVTFLWPPPSRKRRLRAMQELWPAEGRPPLETAGLYLATCAYLLGRPGQPAGVTLLADRGGRQEVLGQRTAPARNPSGWHWELELSHEGRRVGLLRACDAAVSGEDPLMAIEDGMRPLLKRCLEGLARLCARRMRGASNRDGAPPTSE